MLAVFDRTAIPSGTIADAAARVDPRLPELGLRVVLPRERVADFVAEHALHLADRADYDRLRLTLGVPDGSRDLVVDRSLLLESGFEELHGVSFTKGCFVGQELTARTKHRGLVKKRLLPVRVDGPLPAARHAHHTRRQGCRRDALRCRQSGAGAAAAGAAGGDRASPARRRGRPHPAPPRWLPLSVLG